ncbi:zinc-ribbon domain-containing protein [Henriciella mobilis]|uniref:zinc ribbon domain-containing protein n=1 Tax=Henriciella mobilis TaxID=2305467 RepID=UPI000E6651E6|nr:zinc ribbon domain-containing protein [Henriciella mobilis]RIJ16817.1 zinc-ribbon domain-containing protein [Henriciella mobilis]RIJ19506.1 zinc-ribbon domain-containing protein [Henriciella mobilis]
MASQPLVLTDPDLLAEFVRESEFKAFLEKRFATPPDLAALLFRNGELIDTYKGAHFSAGGLVNAVKSVVGGSSHIAMMLADLKPFQVQLPVFGTSKDDVYIEGLATLELQLDPDKPSNILGLMSGVSRNESDGASKESAPSAGRKSLSRMDVLERIAPHFSDRVMEAALRQVNAEDIRGERGLQDKIQADMMQEAERVCGDIGVMVRAVSVEWALSDVEREALLRARLNREQDMLDHQLSLLKREVERQSEATEIRVTANVDMAKLESASEDELAHMVLNSEVAFLDAREQATRRQEMEALAHEIEVLRTERAAKLENDLAEASHLTDLTSEASRLRTVEREIELLDAKHVAEMKKIGAFTDVEIRERSERMELELARIAQEQSAANLRSLMDIEHSGKDRDTDRDIRGKKADTENEIAKVRADTDFRTAQLQAGAKMSPEQIMAINAGLSPDVANVLIEQARAKAGGGESTMEAMRELVRGAAEEREAGRRHELDILKAGMAGATGVAHGAGGKSGHEHDSGLETSPTTVDCPKCGRTLPAKANFCTGCGHKLRT